MFFSRLYDRGNSCRISVLTTSRQEGWNVCWWCQKILQNMPDLFLPWCLKQNTSLTHWLIYLGLRGSDLACKHTGTTDINTLTSCPCQWREMFAVRWDVWESERITYYWPPPRVAPPGIEASGTWSPFPPALWHFCRAHARHRKTPLLYPMTACLIYRSYVRC